MDIRREKSSILKSLAWPILLVSLCAVGCIWNTWRDFRPVKQQRPIILFDRYTLDIFAGVSGAQNFICDVSFIKPLRIASHVDTIPILFMDSPCFDGDCLGSRICYQPESCYGQYIEQIETGRVLSPTQKPLFTKDLIFDGGKILLHGFVLENTLRIPEICRDRDVTVIFLARLLDRKSGRTIASESKSVLFEIKKRTRPQLIS